MPTKQEYRRMFEEAQAITDPVKRDKALKELGALVMSDETLPLTLDPVGDIARDPEYQPGPAAQPYEEVRLRRNIDLAEKIKTNPRMDTFSDEELEELVSGFSETVTPEMATEEIAARKDSSLGKSIVRKSGNVVAGFEEALTTTPIALAGIIANAIEGTTGLDLAGDDLLQTAADVSDDLRRNLGISQPRNIGESAASIAGGLATPLPGMAGPKTMLGNVAEVATPFVIGSGAGRVAANFVTGVVADQGIRELSDDESSPYETVFDKLGDGPDQSYPEAVKNLLIGLGGLSATSVITPALVAAWKSRPVKKVILPQDVADLYPNAPKDLQTLERAGDVYKTHIVDEKTVLTELAKRAGVADFDYVKTAIDHDTQTAAKMKINEGMRTGTIRTVNGDLVLPVAPEKFYHEYKRLPQEQQKTIDTYLKLRDYSDDLKLRINRGFRAKQSIQELSQVKKSISDIEQLMPEAKIFHDRYQQITRSVRQFLGKGPNAMLNKQELQTLDMERPNFVPYDLMGVNPTENILKRVVDAKAPIDPEKAYGWYRQSRNYKEPTGIEGRVDSVETLLDYTRNAIKAKMENDVRGVYIRNMKDSIYGSKTVRRRKKAEEGLYDDRTVTVYEGGKVKKYLSSKLQGELLKFDPYVAQWPILYAPKRMMELGTTGPLSLTFAPITAIRDTFAGWIFTPKGEKGPGPISTSMAIPNALFRKGQMAFADALRGSTMRAVLGPQQADNWANQISASYMNSLYHLANESGGFDASLLKTNIETGKGILRELRRSAQTAGNVNYAGKPLRLIGHSLHGLYSGLEAVFDAISEAPRFASYRKNVKAGMDPREAALKARALTGDNTRSGRVYSPEGKRITGDAQNKMMLAPSFFTGPVIEGIREATPYVNPMVQGIRKMANAFIDDPVRTNLKAWTAVGLPSLIALGWNEMLGDEYNQHAFERRSSRDIAMNMYFGLPDRPPEHGIQIPLPHEITMFNSPLTTGLYSIMRGDPSDETRRMMMHMAGTSLENVGMIGFPTTVGIMTEAMGVNPPDSVLNPWNWDDDAYQMREDNVGLLPQNVEGAVRAAFGSISELALMTAAAGWEGGPEAFIDEFQHQFKKRVPILKHDVTTPVTSYTPQYDMYQNEMKSVEDFLALWGEHFNPDKAGTFRSRAYSSMPLEGEDADSPRHMSPVPTAKPTNPIYAEYGGIIKASLENNDLGMEGLDQRYSVIGKQIKRLKGYHAGRRGDFKEFQEEIVGKDKEYQTALAELKASEDTMSKKEFTSALKKLENSMGQAAAVDRLLTENNIDLSNRDDILKLVSILEKRRGELLDKQISIVRSVEDKMTEILQADGLLPQGQRFDVTKHLKPHLFAE